MARSTCPKCGQRLKLPETLSSEDVLRCPKCSATFRLAGQAAGADVGYDEQGMGWVGKSAFSLVAALGVVLLSVLLYGVLKGPSKEGGGNMRVLAPPTTSAPAGATSAPASARGFLPKWEALGVGLRQPGEPSPPLKPLSAQELFKRASPAVVRVVVRDKDFAVIGQGSGFFVSADGLLVTNAHVIEKAHFASVLLPSNATLFVNGVLAFDPNADLALLKVNGTGLDFLHLSLGQPPPVGAKVYAIGNPQGLTNTLSEGLVSAHRDANGTLAKIQTTAPISPGSSGGPLLAEDGKVVGVMKSFLVKGQNLNFAIPAEKVRGLLASRGKLQALASAGGLRMEKEATDKLDQAWEAMFRKDWSGATAILTELRRTDRENPFVWYALGYLHGQLGNDQIAIEQFKQAISLKADYVWAYWSMGVAYAELGRHAEAIAAFQKVIALKPDYAWAYGFLGIAYAQHGRYAEAIAAFQKAIALKPDDARGYLGMGNAYGHLGRHADAIAAFQKAIALKPDDADAYWCMGNAYALLGRHADAIAAYQKAIALKPDYAVAYYWMGRAYAELGRHAEAIAAYQKAITLKPDYADAYCWMGIAYAQLRRHAEAIAAYQKAIALEPDDASAYCFMGNAYGELGRHAEAVAAYREYLRLAPQGSLAGDARAQIVRLQSLRGGR